MIGDDVGAAGFQRGEYRSIHFRAVDAQEAQVVIVEHQRHEIELRVGEAGRDRLLEWLHDGHDRCGLTLQGLVALGERHGRRTRRRGRRGRCSGRRCGGVRIAIAFRRGGCGRRLVGITGPALAEDLSRGADRTGQELGRVAAGGAEIERGAAGAQGDELQHLLGLAALVVRAVGGASVGARHDVLDLLRRQRLRVGDAGEQAEAKDKRGGECGSWCSSQMSCFLAQVAASRTRAEIVVDQSFEGGEATSRGCRCCPAHRRRCAGSGRGRRA